MKKLVLFSFAFLFVFALNADVSLNKLKASHINAMKYYGRGEILAERNCQIFFLAVNKDIASCFMGSEIFTTYMEKNDTKIYAELTPVEGGFQIHAKINLKSQVYEYSMIIKTGEKEFSLKYVSNDRIDWPICYKCPNQNKIFQCLHCMTDWKCWATCAGPDLLKCLLDCNYF